MVGVGVGWADWWMVMVVMVVVECEQHDRHSTGTEPNLPRVTSHPAASLVGGIKRLLLLMETPLQEVIDPPRTPLSRLLVLLFQLRIIALLRKLRAAHFHRRREALLKSEECRRRGERHSRLPLSSSCLSWRTDTTMS